MSLFDQISSDIKAAMLARDKQRLEALRGVKKEFLEAKTAKGSDGDLPRTATRAAGPSVCSKIRASTAQCWALACWACWCTAPSARNGGLTAALPSA